MGKSKKQILKEKPRITIDKFLNFPESIFHTAEDLHKAGAVSIAEVLLDKYIHTKYSKPVSLKKWQYVFGVGKNKIREIVNGDDYHFVQVSDRKWKLPLDEFPAEYNKQIEEYRSHINSKKS